MKKNTTRLMVLKSFFRSSLFQKNRSEIILGPFGNQPLVFLFFPKAEKTFDNRRFWIIRSPLWCVLA